MTIIKENILHLAIQTGFTSTLYFSESRTPVLNTYDYKIDNSDCVSLTEKLPPSQPNQENAHTYEMVDIPRPYVNINFR